jgi:hypothetical protein
MRIFSKMLKAALIAAFLAPAAFAEEGIYNRDLVRGFIALKSGLYSMKSNGVKFINYATGEIYSKDYLGAQAEIGAEYLQLRTWFDINFMPQTPTRGDTEWYTYGVTWMWGYKLLKQNSILNIIPSIGPGIELQNIRGGEKPAVDSRVVSSWGPTLNLELELRLQVSQFSIGVYGGYKVVRFDSWTGNSAGEAPPFPSSGDINADKAFVGGKLTWTMLNNFQRREKDLQ